MRPSFARALALTVMTGAASLATVAHGYEPYRTSGGALVRWFEPELTLAVSLALPEDLGRDAALAAVTRGLEAWAGAGCDPPAVTVSARDDAALSPDDRVASVIWFDDAEAWNERFSQTELARTILIHRSQSGALVDADIAVNLGGYPFAAGEACVVEGYDLRSTLTHELGHFFGLDHSDVEGATMERRSVPGDCSMRTLEADDIAGLCAIYEQPTPAEPDTTPEPSPEPAPESSEPVAEPAPRHDDGCAAGAPPCPLAWSLAWLAALAIRRGRRASA